MSHRSWAASSHIEISLPALPPFGDVLPFIPRAKWSSSSLPRTAVELFYSRNCFLRWAYYIPTSISSRCSFFCFCTSVEHHHSFGSSSFLGEYTTSPEVLLSVPSLPSPRPHPLQPGRVATSTRLARNPLSIGSSLTYSVNPTFSDAPRSVVKAGEDPSPIWDDNLLKECQRNMLVISWRERFIGIQYFLFLISECLLWEI